MKIKNRKTKEKKTKRTHISSVLVCSLTESFSHLYDDKYVHNLVSTTCTMSKRTKLAHEELKFMIFERNDAFGGLLSTANTAFYSCYDIAVLCYMIFSTYYYNIHWLQWPMKIAKHFCRVKFSNYIHGLFFVFVVAAIASRRCNTAFNEHIRIHRWFRSSKRKDTLQLLFANGEIATMGIWKIQRHFWFFCSSISYTNCLIFHVHVYPLTHTSTLNLYEHRNVAFRRMYTNTRIPWSLACCRFSSCISFVCAFISDQNTKYSTVSVTRFKSLRVTWKSRMWNILI